MIVYPSFDTLLIETIHEQKRTYYVIDKRNAGRDPATKKRK